jgi:hypothetical protein
MRMCSLNSIHWLIQYAETKVCIIFWKLALAQSEGKNMAHLLHFKSEPLDGVHASDELGTGQNEGWYMCTWAVSIIQNI